jgi:putative transposase
MNGNLFGPNRQSIRIREFDYASPGAYFITICTQDRVELFGDVIGGQMRLSPVGTMVEKAWKNIPQYAPRIGLDEFIVMPNHVHGIVTIGLDGWDRSEFHRGRTRRSAPTMTWDIGMVGAGFHPRPRLESDGSGGSVSAIIQRFKSWTTYQFRMGIKRQGAEPLRRRLWQRNYYEHIVRNDGELDRIREYIRNNPQNWDTDPENHNSPSLAA